MRLQTILIVLTLLASLASADTFQGRTYVIYDGRLNDRPAPLILSLHGAGGSGPQQQSYTGFDRIAALYDVVVVYPSAPTNTWNDGRWEALGDTGVASRDDVGWLQDLAAEMARQGLIDPDRIYAMGHANGGGMVRRLTCDRPDFLAGAAMISSALLIDFTCKNVASVPTAYFAGTADPLNPFSGRPTGMENIATENIGRAFSAPASASLLAAGNGCGIARQTVMNDDPNDGIVVIRHDYQFCRDRVVYYEMQGAGHAWPGARKLSPNGIGDMLGGPIRDINAGLEAMRLWFGDAL